MNTIQFAIASIVDANTGYALGQDSSHVPDYRAAQQRGREIRAKSIIALFALMKSAINSSLAKLEQIARNRRETESVLNLTPQLLRDIGLHNEDVTLLRDGLINLEELGSRRSHHGSKVIRNSATVTRLDADTRQMKAANQANLPQANCA